MLCWRDASPGGWCRMSGAGPAAPPPPAMTSPGRASTWISRMPKSAARQDLAAAMWRRTAARLRNRPRLDSWPVAVQWAHTNRVTVTPSPNLAVGPAGLSLALAAMTATATSKRVLKVDVTCIACHRRRTSLLVQLPKSYMLVCTCVQLVQLGTARDVQKLNKFDHTCPPPW